MRDGHEILKLKDATQAQTDMERFVRDILQDKGRRTVSELAERVAEEMYDDALKYGGWAVDIGIWGPSLCSGDALALLDDTSGRCLAVEGKNDR